MPSIVQLDEVTINQIAAGEVIDRPASIVKELIENSLDSGASRVTVTLKAGGKLLIRVSDNGSGIDKDDLPLAPLRHATSKITRFNDIYEVSSFGFRGEALASMCHAGRLHIVSSKPDTAAYQITAINDDISEVCPANHPPGTTIDVSDLFFDLPVRRKFLKSNGTETAHCYDIVLQFALCRPDVDFILNSDGQEMLNSSGITDQKLLLCHLFGKDIKDQLIAVDTVMGPVSFKGIIGDATLTFGKRNRQIISINGRLIKSPIIQKAISQGYRDYIPPRRFPLVLLDISVHPSDVDVNIHPQKQDVKFVSPGIIFETFPKLVRLMMQGAHSPLSQTMSANQSVETESMPPSTSPISGTPSPIFYPKTASIPAESPAQSTLVFDPISPTDPAASFAQTESTLPNLDLSTTAELTYFQLFDTYIVLKTGAGLWVLDQHAVHERILYERFKENAMQDQNNSQQPLLLSEVIDLTPGLFQVFLAEASLLRSIGFLIEEFGPSQVVVREIPSVFASFSIEKWLVDVLETAKDAPGNERDLILDQKEVLQMRACKAAIKAGMRMSDLEVKQLLIDLQASPGNFTCPHGRPLFITLSKNDLERLFLRS